jgi:hypothetical protein
VILLFWFLVFWGSGRGGAQRWGRSPPFSSPAKPVKIFQKMPFLPARQECPYGQTVPRPVVRGHFVCQFAAGAWFSSVINVCSAAGAAATPATGQPLPVRHLVSVTSDQRSRSLVTDFSQQQRAIPRKLHSSCSRTLQLRAVSISVDKMPAWTWNSGRLDRCRQKLANGKKAPPIHGNRYWLHDTTWYVVSGSRHRRGSWAAAHRRCGGQRGGVPACALSAGCHPRQAVETVSDCTVLWVVS